MSIYPFNFQYLYECIIKMYLTNNIWIQNVVIEIKIPRTRMIFMMHFILRILMVLKTLIKNNDTKDGQHLKSYHIVVDENNYEFLKDLGRVGDSFNDAVTKLRMEKTVKIAT